MAFTFSGFGAQPAQPAQPSQTPAFGQPQTQQQQQQQGTTSLFGQQPQQPATGTGTGLFGQPAQQQQQQAGAPTGGAALFGSTTTAGQQQQPSTGLFGNTSTTAPGTTGFGAGSLFGNTGAAAAAKPAFGTSTTAPAGGLFSQPQQQQSQQQQQQQQQQQGLNQSQFTAGQPQQPQQQLAPWESGLEPGLQLDPALMVDVPGDMLFEDIEKKHPQLASWILNVEQAFARERKLREGIDTHGLGGKLLEDRQEIRRIESSMQIYLHAITSLRARVHRLAESAERASKAFETCVECVGAAKAGMATGGSTVVAHRNFYLQFFQQLTEEMKDQMIRYRKTLDQIERGLMSLQRIQHMPTPQAIATAVSNNQETIMSLAGEIAGVEERIKNLAAFYRQEFRAKMNTVVDPFVLARTEAGEPALGYSGKRGERALDDDIDRLNV
ncbi:hypothetical protein NliqN6_5061 [Naganishia liquefaciens]|uniref:Nucleoporin Nup54 alpha-helical domain-containing protein n=1 Tax=Naganishia liquefaciens TaxID=104408 RepID=A0A8H3YGU0_9TREE|nr:hypothetical protein NliqN6_5061 [Naganishia liquefaciens]